MWKLDLSQLKHIKLKDYIVRFLFGGAVSVLAALIAEWSHRRHFYRLSGDSHSELDNY